MGVRLVNYDTAIKQLIKYRDSLAERQKKFLEALADIGIKTASVRFSQAQYDGVNDVVVNNHPEWVDENTLLVSATGRTVLFIEFGTGVVYTEKHPKADELHMERGTYGQGKGSQRTWAYYGEPGTNGWLLADTPKGELYGTHGNPPARAMYDAGKEIREQIRKVAEEVFGSD